MWKQKENILRNFFDKKLQIPNIKVERGHIVGTKQVSGKRTIVSKFTSLKDKQKVLSDTRKVEGTNININEDYSKEPLKISGTRLLGPFRFLIYINDLSLFSKYFPSFMFADDANLFYSHKSIKNLIKNANYKLKNISQWFKVKEKTKFTLFHKPLNNGNLPLQLPNLRINNYKIRKSLSIKFLVVLVDENFTYLDHITNSPKT